MAHEPLYSLNSSEGNEIIFGIRRDWYEISDSGFISYPIRDHGMWSFAPKRAKKNEISLFTVYGPAICIGWKESGCIRYLTWNTCIHAKHISPQNETAFITNTILAIAQSISPITAECHLSFSCGCDSVGLERASDSVLFCSNQCMGFQSEGSPKPNTFHWNAHIFVITSSMNVSLCCSYKEGRLLSYKRVQSYICVLLLQRYSHLKTNLWFPVIQIVKRNSFLQPFISKAAVPILL